jgi:hypothetical protein
MIVRCELCGYHEDITKEEFDYNDGFIQCQMCDEGILETME